MRVAAVGECTIDRYLDQGVERVGGISLNFAVNARHVGAFAALVTATGEDRGAALVRSRLNSAGIDMTAVHTLPGRTATQDIHMAPGGERIFPPGGYDPGVLSDLRLSESDLSHIWPCNIVAVPYFRQISHLYAAILADPFIGRNSRIVVDLLDGSDCGPDLEELRADLPRLAIVFISGGLELVGRLSPLSVGGPAVVVTHGAQGSTALVEGDATYQPAIPVRDPVDTTGCGDAFQAAFTLAYLGGAEVSAALAAGAERASVVIRYLGATDGWS